MGVVGRARGEGRGLVAGVVGRAGVVVAVLRRNDLSDVGVSLARWTGTRLGGGS